jgi:hypothetical protein
MSEGTTKPEPADRQRFNSLLRPFVDGEMDGAQLAELGRLIESDATLRHEYLEYCQIHGLLRAEHGLLASWDVAEVEPNRNFRAPARRRRLRWVISLGSLAAAVLLAVTFGFLQLAPEPASAPIVQPPYRGEVVARLRHQVRANFAYGPKGEATPLVGAIMPQGTYELLGGILELELNTGVILTIEAPAVFTLADTDCVHVESGRVAAHVPQEAIGFRVETASATVVDLGTDFAIEAIRGKESEVHVFNGEVRVNLHGSKAISASPLRLTTGEATRIDFLTGIPSGIDLDDQRFLRRLEVAPGTYAHRVLELEPAVYYPMDPSDDGTKLRSLVPQQSDAEIFFGRASQSVWATGKIGLAFALGGPSQQTYAVAAEYPRADGDELSVVAWVLANSRPRWASIAKNWAGADDRGQFHFGLYFDSGELEAHIEDSSGEEIIVKDSEPLPLHRWHHVAFVADGAMLRLYRNGQEVDAAPYHRLHRDPRIKALAIGTKLNLTGDEPDAVDFNMWDGRLDEVAIFNRALSPEQIGELYKLGAAEN